MAKRIPKEIKSKIQQEYEFGVDLIELAIKYKVNYGTLRHIASKNEWQKNIVADLAWLKEIEKLSDKLAKKRESKKQEYKAITQTLLNDLKTLESLEDRDYVIDEDTSKSFAESKATALKIRASAIKEVYSIDKELHNILTSDEEITLKTKTIKYLELKERITNSGSNTKPEQEGDVIID